MRDSKIIINWITSKSSLNVINLDCSKLRTETLRDTFQSISFEAEALLKEALGFEVGSLNFKEYVDRSLIYRGSF